MAVTATPYPEHRVVTAVTTPAGWVAAITSTPTVWRSCPSAAVSVVVPSRTPVTTPSVPTVATLGSAVVNATPLAGTSSPTASVTRVATRDVAPMPTRTVVGVSTSVVGVGATTATTSCDSAPLRTVIDVEPAGPTDVTVPSAPTVASAGLLDANVIALPAIAVPTRSSTCASSFAVPFCGTVIGAGCTRSVVATAVTVTGTARVTPAPLTLTDAVPAGPTEVMTPVGLTVTIASSFDLNVTAMPVSSVPA